ncbi:hypothetical protein Pmani_034014 [Petrolisthes manimaculis]|uniref:Uncharacterized protein n=1 Tax=Petrolisthes manimaculis TaxID=1843537 RepID=A0AAE1NPZ0_9EUCA|nr:hypothetical protein Pmani_034014 [Petrolisthes manimaculis]
MEAMEGRQESMLSRELLWLKSQVKDIKEEWRSRARDGTAEDTLPRDVNKRHPRPHNLNHSNDNNNDDDDNQHPIPTPPPHPPPPSHPRDTSTSIRVRRRASDISYGVREAVGEVADEDRELRVQLQDEGLGKEPNWLHLTSYARIPVS